MTETDRCFICGFDNQNVLEQHHLVPRRYGGTDMDSNLVTLCSNCHAAIEKLYNNSFFSRVTVRLSSRVRSSEDTVPCPSAYTNWRYADFKELSTMEMVAVLINEGREEAVRDCVLSVFRDHYRGIDPMGQPISKQKSNGSEERVDSNESRNGLLEKDMDDMTEEELNEYIDELYEVI